MSYAYPARTHAHEHACGQGVSARAHTRGTSNRRFPSRGGRVCSIPVKGRRCGVVNDAAVGTQLNPEFPCSPPPATCRTTHNSRS